MANLQKQWNNSISLLRIVATIAVVFLHVNSTIYSNFKLSQEEYSLFSIMASFGNWAVPVFFIITGYLLLDSRRKISIRDCFVKYVRRMILVLFIFGVPMACMIRLFSTKAFYSRLILDSIFDMLGGNSFAHLWYVYALLGVYLLLPMLKVFVDHSSRTIQLYILIIFFIFNFCIPIYNTYAADWGGYLNLYLPASSYILFYVLIGNFLRDFSLEKNISLVLLLLSSSFFLLVSIFSKGSSVILGYGSPLVAVWACCIFINFIKFDSNILKSIDRLCFCVYLIHPIPIQFCYRVLGLSPINFQHKILATIIFSFVFVLLSYVISLILNKISLLRKYVL